MGLTLLALHGFTQNGAQLSAQLAELTARFPSSVQVICPDAPNLCSDVSVQRMAAAFSLAELKPPHLCWWDASDDGKVYRGWEQAYEQLRELSDQPNPVGVLGFSQGAIAAAAMAGLHANGQLPALAFAVLIAGITPRSDLLAPLFQTPVALPSLHIWGEKDGFAKGSGHLVEAFAPEDRHVEIWPGPHTVPTRGPAADAIVAMVKRFADHDSTAPHPPSTP